MKYKILFIFVLVTLLILYIWHPNTLYITDIWFHLLLAKQSATQQLIPMWDTFAFQPIGRIQLYPPLLHILLGIIANVFSWQFVTHYLGILVYLVFLIVFFLFCTHFWGEHKALIMSLAATLSLTTTLTFLSFMPAAVAMIIILSVFLLFVKERYLYAGILLGITFYVHPVFPYLAVLGLFYYVRRYHQELTCRFKKTAQLAFLVASPWILWTITHIASFNLYRFWFDNPLEGYFGFSFLTHYDLNVVYIPLAFWGIYRLRHYNDVGLDLVRALLYGFLPVFIFYGGRYTWHLMPFLSIFPIIAITQLRWFKKLYALLLSFPIFYRYAYTSIFGLIVLLLPMPLFSYPPSYNLNTVMSLDWSAFALPTIQADGFSAHADFKDVVEIIKNSPKNTIIHSNHPDIGSALTFFTDRGSDYGLFWENTTTDLLDSLEAKRETERPMIFVYQQEEIPYETDTVYTIGNFTIGERF